MIGALMRSMCCVRNEDTTNENEGTINGNEDTTNGNEGTRLTVYHIFLVERKSSR